jgi:FG-GAP repeat protein/pre-peptidase
LNTTFAATGVYFTLTAPINEKYPAVYVGGTDSAFAGYGSFLGISETIDSGNQNKTDEAFVFSDNINSTSTITETIAHEAGHLIGYLYSGAPYINPTSNFAAITELVSGVTKITASDAAADDMFGNSVAIDGDNVVVGAYFDDDDGFGSGSELDINGLSYGDYFWHVLATDNNGNSSEWSTVDIINISDHDIDAGGSFNTAPILNVDEEYFPDATKNNSWDTAQVLDDNPVEGWVGFGDSSDWYEFDLTDIGTVELELTELHNDANIKLYYYDNGKEKLKCIGKAKQKGTADELISEQAVAGTYYTEVIPGKKENSASYNLDLDITYNSI